MKEKKMTQITKKNIKEVFIHNGINNDIRIGTSLPGISSIYLRHESISRDIFSCDLDRNWLAALEAFLGIKLEPLPDNPFDVVKIGQWTRNINNNTWYERLAGNNINYRHGCSGCYCISTAPEDWDLTDIRDYNPDEIVLKKGDKIKFKGGGYNYTIVLFDYEHSGVILDLDSLPYNRINSIYTVNGKCGKFVIPPYPFNFAQYLTEHGFFVGDHQLVLMTRKQFTIFVYPEENIFSLAYCENSMKYSMTKANADKLIAAAKILGELE